MKKILLFGLLSLILTVTKAQDAGPSFVLKTNPLASMGGGVWVLGFVPLTAELPRVTAEIAEGKFGFQLSGAYLGKSLLLQGDLLTDSTNSDAKLRVNGFRVQVMPKYYISGEAPEGFYIAPHFSLARATIQIDGDGTDEKLQAIQALGSFVLGYQVITEGNFALDIYSGFGLKSFVWSYEDPDNSINDEFNSGIFFRVPVGLNFGYKF